MILKYKKTRNREAGGKTHKKQANPGIKKYKIKKHLEHEEHWKHRTDVGKQNRRTERIIVLK